MRNTNERVSAVKQRAKEINHRKKIRNNKILSISSVAASFTFIVCLAMAMPNIMDGLTKEDYSNSSGFGSIFSSENIIGFVLIALLAFALGVCVTLLCVHLHRKVQKTQEDI